MKVGHKSRRGRHKRRPKPHAGHRKAGATSPGSDQRKQRVNRRRQLQAAGE